jgi:hypothetical protein
MFRKGAGGMTISSRIADCPPSVEWDKLPLLLSDKQAALVLGVSRGYLQKARCENTHHGRTPAPPFVEIGGRRYYRTADLTAWVNGLAGRMAI